MDSTQQDWIYQVDARWKAAGINALIRRQLRRNLERDLDAARRAGTSTSVFTTSDPAEFADEVARACGEPPEPVAGPWEGVAFTALGGALAGAALVWLVIWPVLLRTLSTASDSQVVAISYPLGGVIVLLGTGVALRLRYGPR